MLAGMLHHTGCTLILVNQMRNKPGVVSGRPNRPTGGRAIGYFAALRLETVLVQSISTGRQITGQSVLVRVHKCKYGPPGGQIGFELLYEEGLTV